MIPFIILIFVQLLIAAIVVFFLKGLLDRELEKSALEKLMSLKKDSVVKVISVYHAQPLSEHLKQQLTAVLKDKFTEGKIFFEQLSSIKGGLMIKLGDEVLDFSVSSRLENFWS